ncbi:MAG: hypothetical protein RLZ84_641 [Actinomycetota bacterium]
MFGAVFVCIAALCAVGVSRVGAALVQQATVQNIADSAALAGATTFDKSTVATLLTMQRAELNCLEVDDLVVRVCVSKGAHSAMATAAAGPVTVPTASPND